MTLHVRDLALWFLGVTAAVAAVLGWARRRTKSPRALAGGGPTIVIEPEGFAVELRAGEERLRVPWRSVSRVGAYKRDLVTTDEIVLAFEVVDNPGRVLELSEEWPGFADLFAPMERELGVSPAWYTEIMTPAFAPTPRILFDRSNGTP